MRNCASGNPYSRSRLLQVELGLRLRTRHVRCRATGAVGKIGLQAQSAIAAVDQPLHHVRQLPEFPRAQAIKLDVVALTLARRQLGEPRPSLFGYLETHPPAIVRIRRLVDQTP